MNGAYFLSESKNKKRKCKLKCAAGEDQFFWPQHMWSQWWLPLVPTYLMVKIEIKVVVLLRQFNLTELFIFTAHL